MGYVMKILFYGVLIAISLSFNALASEIVGINGKVLDGVPVDVAQDGRIVFVTREGKRFQIAVENIVEPNKEKLADWLGLCAEDALNGDRVIGRAWRLAEKGDALGGATAAGVLAICLMESKPRLALDAALRSAERGSSSGALLAGIFYKDGVGALPSRIHALRWYKRAYEMGSGFGALEMARESFRKNRFAEATDWVLRATEVFQQQRNRQGLVKLAQLAEDYGQNKMATLLFEQAQQIAYEGARKESPSEREKPPILGGTGTGWFITPRELVTCWHVVQGCSRLSLYSSEEKREISLRLIAHDAKNDIALLSVMDEAFTCTAPIPLAETPPGLAAGVFTLGFPMQDTLGKSVKYTEGTVSALQGIQGDPTHLQISAPIQPGNSGGPLLNSRGEAVGMVTSMLSAVYTLTMADVVPQNVNYAVKIDYVRLLLQSNAIRYTGKARGTVASREELVKDLGRAVFLIRARP